MGVAAVNEDITVIQQRQELFNHVVHSLACLDHHEHLARRFEACDQLFEAVAADDVLSYGPAVYKLINLFRRAVENRHREALGLHVHDEVFAHDGKANEANICFFHNDSSFRAERFASVQSAICYNS